MKNNKNRKQKINLEERLILENLKNEDKNNISKISRILHRTRKTVKNELKRVKGIYNAYKANEQAERKQRNKTKDWKKITSSTDLFKYIKEKFELDWSPEEISGRLKYIDRSFKYVSTKTIYNYVFSVYGRSLEKYLRYGKRKSNKQYMNKEKIDNRVFIKDRPKKVEKRVVFGDWEADFICSGRKGKGYLLVFVERKTRYIIIKKINTKDMETVHRLFREVLGVEYIVNTLTLDNDIVFRRHEQLSKEINAPIYFTHPYHSWEKGTVENMNKWIRQYIKKRSDISKYTDEYIKEVEYKLNNRPRKCLNFKTPKEAILLEKYLKKEISMISLNKIFTVLKN